MDFTSLCLPGGSEGRADWVLWKTREQALFWEAPTSDEIIDVLKAKWGSSPMTRREAAIQEDLSLSIQISPSQASVSHSFPNKALTLT